MYVLNDRKMEIINYGYSTKKIIFLIYQLWEQLFLCCQKKKASESESTILQQATEWDPNSWTIGYETIGLDNQNFNVNWFGKWNFLG